MPNGTRWGLTEVALGARLRLACRGLSDSAVSECQSEHTRVRRPSVTLLTRSDVGHHGELPSHAGAARLVLATGSADLGERSIARRGRPHVWRKGHRRHGKPSGAPTSSPFRAAARATAEAQEVGVPMRVKYHIASVILTARLVVWRSPQAGRGSRAPWSTTSASSVRTRSPSERVPPRNPHWTMAALGRSRARRRC